MIEKAVKITNNGMISIPAPIRKKYNIKDGDYVVVVDDETGALKIYPIEDVESLRKRSFKVDEFKKIYTQSRNIDLELEK